MCVKVSARTVLLLVLIIAWTPQAKGLYRTARGGGHVDCNHIHEYHDIHNLIENDRCLPTTDLFPKLKHIREPKCLEQLVHELAAYFHSGSSHCFCPGNYHYAEYNHHELFDNSGVCSRSSPYSKIYDQYFRHPGIGSTAQCMSHHSLWQDLFHLKADNKECLMDMVEHLGFAFEHVRDECHCHLVAQVVLPVQPVTVVTQPPVVFQGSLANIASTLSSTTCAAVATNPSYQELMRLYQSDECLSANSVWHLLNPLEVNIPCRDTVMHLFAEKYTNVNSNNCECHPVFNFHDHHLEHSRCKDVKEGTYKELYATLFEHQREHGCMDHSYLWPRLVDIKNFHHNEEFENCRNFLISHAAGVYGTVYQDPCTCTQVRTPSPATLKPTTAVPTTTTTTTTTQATTSTIKTTTLPKITATSQSKFPTTTLQPTSASPTPQAYSCSITQTMMDITSTANVQHSLATPCQQTGNDESLVLTECNVSSPATWRRGINVLAECQSGSPSIPAFVPVATFTSDTFVSSSAHSAIFLKCNANGFEAVVEYCGNPPLVIDVSSTPNLNEYYTVV